MWLRAVVIDEREAVSDPSLSAPGEKLNNLSKENLCAMQGGSLSLASSSSSQRSPLALKIVELVRVSS